jgi:hypothetical protein
VINQPSSAQETRPEFVHRIGADGCVRFVNAEWAQFGRENGLATTASAVIGQPLLAAISDAETRHLYQVLIERVRGSDEMMEFGYRCDSPDCRRWLQMRMRWLEEANEVEFASVLLRSERRETVALLDIGQQRSRDLLSMCSWCKQVLAEQSWVEVEQAIARLQLFADRALPRISHGICPTCSERLCAITLESA